MEISFIQMQSRQKRSLQFTSQPSDVDVTNTNEIVAFKVEAAGVEVISGSLAVIMEPAGSQQDLQEVVHQK